MTLLSNLLLYAAILAPIVYVLYLVATSSVVRAVFYRNVMSYFSGILGYLFIVVFVVVAAILAFNAQFFTANLANLDQLTKNYPLLLLFIVPAITMTVWAEERKQGTDELLFTLPGNDVEILIGKYLAVVAVYTVALIFSTGLWAVLAFYSDPGFRMFLSTYLGYWFAGASLLAVGMFASSLTKSPTVAFVLGGILCAVPVFLSASALGGSSGFLQNNETIARWLESLTAFSVGEHLHEFSLGVVRLSSVLYFESLAVVFLYLNLIVISERHWSRKQKWQMGLQYAVRAVSVLAILVSLYVVVTQSSGRADIDLTPQKYFTLSDATIEALDRIEDDRPVTIQAFISPNVPTDYVRAKRELEGLLRQIDQRGGSRVEVRVIDTAKYQPSADEAKSFGIEPREVRAEVDGKFVTEDVYMGLVFQSSYDEVVVPFVGQGTPVEYEITRSLRTVSNALRLTVGIIDEPTDLVSRRAQIVDELRRQYNVESVSLSKAIEREKRVFLIEDEKVLEELKKAEDGDVPALLRETFEKKHTRLSDDVAFQYDAKTDTATLDDKRVHRKYTIRLEKDKPAETEKPPGDEDKPADEADKETAKEEPADAKPDAKKPEPAKPKYGVYTDRYDVVIAVLPSLLPKASLDHLVTYVKDGGPTLIFDDPLPYMEVQYTRGPDGRVQESIQRAPHLSGPEAKFNYAPLLDTLNLEWNFDEVVWDLHNPFPEFEDHPGWKKGFFTVLSQRIVGEKKDADDKTAGQDKQQTEEKSPVESFNEDDSVTKGLGRMLLMYAGRIRQQSRKTLAVTPLLRTGPVSGIMQFDDLVEESFSFDPMMGRPSQIHALKPLQETLPVIDRTKLSEKDQKALLSKTLFQPDSGAHMIAAHIQPLKDRNTHAIFVADADVIGDVFFELRTDRALSLDLDNVSFVLNAVDVLAGENAFLELRRRKPPQPSLSRIEKYKEGLRANERAAVGEAQTELRKEQIRLNEALKKLEDELENYRANSIGEAVQKMQDVSMTYYAERERLNKREKDLNEQLDRKKQEAKSEYERAVKVTEQEIRLKAIVLPAIPAIALGLIFLSVRLISERREIQPDRRR